MSIPVLLTPKHSCFENYATLLVEVLAFLPKQGLSWREGIYHAQPRND
jgi:hypothetical protein